VVGCLSEAIFPIWIGSFYTPFYSSMCILADDILVLIGNLPRSQ